MGASRALVSAVLFLVPCFATMGCGGAPEKAAVHSVSGKVTAGGAPLAGYLISFMPAAAEATGNIGATATTGSDGSYALESLDGRKGCPAGKFKVVIKPGAAAMQEAMKNMAGPSPGGPPKVETKVPPEYGDSKTSPKEVEVKAQANTIDIEI